MTSPVAGLQSSNRQSSESCSEPSRLTIDIIDNLAQFEELRDEWQQLQSANTQNQHVFQSYRWLQAWLEAYHLDLQSHATTMAIVVARLDGHLRLICPLATRQLLGMKCLSYLGAPASQYGDVLTDGSSEANQLIAPALTVALNQLRPDLVHLRKVRDDAAILPWIRSQQASIVCTDEAPHLDFSETASFDDYCSKFSAKSRKNRRRLRRRLEEIGRVSTTILPAGEEAQNAIRTGISFKQAWLVERGQISSALSDPHMCDFLTNIVSHQSGDNNPFISVMHCGSTPVSVQFGIVSQQRLALHMIAYNPETEKTGAGVLHIEDTIGHCIESGWRELDFLAPNAPYKQAWADSSMPVADYVFTRSIRGQLYARAYLQNARNMLKKQVEALPLSLRQSIARRVHS